MKLGIFSATSGLLITSAGLLHYKHRYGSAPGFPEIRATSTPHAREVAWLKPLADRISEVSYQKLQAAQSTCSGIDLIFGIIDEISRSEFEDSVESFIRRCREKAATLTSFPILKQIDWQSIEFTCHDAKLDVKDASDLVRETILRQWLEHAEFMDVFVTHLTRVPRDIDGRLLPNMDAGCSPPAYILGDVPKGTPTIPETVREECIKEISDRGVVVVKNAVNLDSIEEVRDELHIRTAFSPNKTKRFETRETVPEEIFKDDRSNDVSYTQLASGRYAYQLRCSKLESVVKPLHASVMPVVWEYLSKQRGDSYLNGLLGQRSGTNPRVFLSSVSLVCSDPLSGEDSWHSVNGGGGVVVLIPLSPYEEKNGNTVVLPGSHKAWTGLVGGIARGAETVLRSGGVMELKADCGDAVLTDSRLMTRTLRNESFNRSRVWLAFHYDFTDRRAPYQWLPRTLFMNAVAAAYVHMDNLYRKLPPLSYPNKHE